MQGKAVANWIQLFQIIFFSSPCEKLETDIHTTTASFYLIMAEYSLWYLSNLFETLCEMW